jgi:hypothetical protein
MRNRRHLAEIFRVCRINHFVFLFILDLDNIFFFFFFFFLQKPSNLSAKSTTPSISANGHLSTDLEIRCHVSFKQRLLEIHGEVKTLKFYVQPLKRTNYVNLTKVIALLVGHSFF